MDAQKPGYKTTEFFALILGFVYLVISGLTIDGGVVYFSLLANSELAKWWLAAVLGYTGSRGFVKGMANKTE